MRLFSIFLLQWTCGLLVHIWKGFSKEQNFQVIRVRTSSTWLDCAKLFSKSVVLMNTPTSCIKMPHCWTSLPTVGNVRLFIFHNLMWEIVSYNFHLHVPGISEVKHLFRFIGHSCLLFLTAYIPLFLLGNMSFFLLICS